MFNGTNLTLNSDMDQDTYEGRSICNENSPVYLKVLYFWHSFDRVVFV